MQVIFLLASFSLLVIPTKSASIDVPTGAILTLDDISQSDREYLEYLEDEAVRQKRSGNILDSLKSKLSEGIKTKLSGIASASSHSGSFIGDGSKAFHHYTSPPEDKTFSFWDLQKSIFRTLLQAAKAIKGGLLAIKGQIIKGSGYVISAKGKLISAKGEAITNIGKHIASSAILIPQQHHHEYYSAPSGAGEPVYAHPPSSSGYGGPVGPNVEYHTHHYEQVPSAIGDHKFSHTYEELDFDVEYKDQLPRATNQGILIVKKIPKVKKEEINGNDGAHITPETHKPITESDEPIEPPFTYLPETNPYDHKLSSYGAQSPQYEAPSQPEFVQNLPSQHAFIPPSAQNDLTNFEKYEPYTVPQEYHEMGEPIYNIPKYSSIVKGLEHFPSYPLDLHKRFDTATQYATVLTDALLPPPNAHRKKGNNRVKTKSNSRLKRLPNSKNIKSVSIRLKT